MKLADAAQGVPAGPLVVASSAPLVAAESRLKSLDVVRGFVVVGMIVVNAMAFSSQAYGFDDFGLLTHSRWAGFTFADFVFPAFLFMAGVSVALSMRGARALDGATVSHVSARTVRLLLLGFVVTNIPWTHPIADWRWFGVLQRIGLCYFAGALLFVLAGWRMRVTIAGIILVLYWPLVMLPMPDGTIVDLLTPGTNFVSFIDRNALGAHIWSTGAGGYDPEGILSTLPAIAQCLLGTLAGEWVLAHRHSQRAMGNLALAGAVAACLGLAWSPLFPIVKNIWTSSFVLLSGGLAAMLLAAALWLMDQKRVTLWGAGFFEAFGVNAILVYVLHELAQLIPASGSMHALSADAASSGYPGLMAFFPVAVFIAALWLPLEFMRRKRWIVKI